MARVTGKNMMTEAGMMIMAEVTAADMAGATTNTIRHSYYTKTAPGTELFLYPAGKRSVSLTPGCFAEKEKCDDQRDHNIKSLCQQKSIQRFFTVGIKQISKIRFQSDTGKCQVKP